MAIHIEVLSARRVPSVVDLGADPTLSWTSSVPFPLRHETVEQWSAQSDLAEPSAVTFVVLNEAVAAGCVSLKKIDRASRSAELSYWTGSQHRGRGCAREGAALAVAYAFTRLSLNFVHAHALLHGNANSIRVLSKIGFTHDTSRADLPVSDSFADRFPGDVWRFFRIDSPRSANA